MEKTKKLIKKSVFKRNGIECYLLGETSDGLKVWLPKDSWDCGWYWGFGYVQTRNSHSHAKGTLYGEIETYDKEKKCHIRETIYNAYDAPILEITTFTKEEGYQLTDLFKQYYIAMKYAELLRHRCAWVTQSVVGMVNYGTEDERENKIKEINKTIIPDIMNAVYRILTPKKKEDK